MPNYQYISIKPYPDGVASNLTATVLSDTSLQLDWTLSSTNEYNVILERSVSEIVWTTIKLPAGTTTYIDEGLTTGITYYYRVRVVRAGYYSAYSAIASEMIPFPEFIITVDTTKAGSASNTFVLPTTGAGYACTVDWGDGSSTSHSGTPGNITKVYAASGIYQIEISGIFPQIYFNGGGDRLKLMSINNWGTGVWRNMNNAFYGCSNMIGTYTDSPDTSAVTTMSDMFRDCIVFNQPVNFNTILVNTMFGMFRNCTAFNQPVNFNTSLVTMMSYMFYGCTKFNQPVNFNTSLVNTMAYMFYECAAFNSSVTFSDTSKVTTMYEMFRGCTNFNQPVNFNTVLVNTMFRMFYGCANFNSSVTFSDTSKVTTMSEMFYGCTAFKQSLAAFDVRKVTTMASMITNNLDAAGQTTNWDATLIAWAAQQSLTPALTNNVPLTATGCKYSPTGKTARDILTGSPPAWVITGDSAI